MALPIKHYLSDLIVSVSAGVAIYYLTSQLIKTLEHPPRNNHQSKKIINSLKNKNPIQYNDLKLDEYESFLLDSLILPEDIETDFKDIGGLDLIIDDLRESIIYPLTHPELFPENSILIQPPKGVLLYGPPGCGKTMIAKALAKESEANFLNIKLSNIMDKWYGESNKFINAIFTLARKLQPCIIFIDEIDGFLKKRQNNDHEITTNIKTEFMLLWDGLISNGRILILGATNRPNDIDEAFLRRLSKKFIINKPNLLQRRNILEKILNYVNLESEFDMELLVEQTEGFSGSDLKELCRESSMNIAREYLKLNKDKMNNNEKIEFRSLNNEDFKVEDFKNRLEQMQQYGI